MVFRAELSRNIGEKLKTVMRFMRVSLDVLKKIYINIKLPETVS